jgi:hypothetical protein
MRWPNDRVGRKWCGDHALFFYGGRIVYLEYKKIDKITLSKFENVLRSKSFNSSEFRAGICIYVGDKLENDNLD